MIKCFISHLWKEYMRSPNLGKSIGVNILIGFFIFLMMIYLLALGIFLDKILAEVYPDSDSVKIFNGILIFYFCIDLIIRFFIQGLPKMNIEAYIHLPIGKRKIVHFVVLRTLLGVFNFLPLFVIIPFTINSVSITYGIGPALIWFFSIVILVGGNNFLATYLKRLLGAKPKIIGIISLLLIALFMMNYFGLIKIDYYSSLFFGLFLTYPWIILLPLAYLLFTYNLHYSFLRHRLYQDEIITKKIQRVDAISRIKYFKSLGDFGTLLSLDMRLIWRNKRTRTIIYMTPMFLLYGFFFYPQEIYFNLTGMFDICRCFYDRWFNAELR